MWSLEKQLIHQLVADHLRDEAPEALPALETELEAIFEAMPPRPRGAEGQHPGGLPFDLPQVAWTLVSAAIWISSCLLTEAIRHRKQRSRERALDRLEVLLAEQVLDPLLVHGLRRRLEELLQRTGNLEVLLSDSSVAPGGGATARSKRAGTGGSAPAAGASSSATPDLEIVIRRDRRDGREHLVFELTAADPDLRIDHLRFVSNPFEQPPAAHVGELLPGIADLPLVFSRDPAAVADQLSAIGAALSARLLPPEFEAKLWSLKGRVQSVQIQSEEPFIPWELAKLRCPDPDATDDEPFLCEAFAVARWLLGCPRETRLPLRHIGTVVARDGSVGRATPEIEALLRQADAERVVEAVLALTGPLIDAFASGRYDGWYVAAHGAAKGTDPDGWELYLEQHQKLSARVLEARARGLGRARPLVFLNCCHSGRAGLALTGMGGWSSGFVRAGAGAFIGCYWAVDDQKAHEFAREFYRRFAVDHLPLGEAFRQARLWLRDRYPGDPTWLAYTLFGHPGAGGGKSPGSEEHQLEPDEGN